MQATTKSEKAQEVDDPGSQMTRQLSYACSTWLQEKYTPLSCVLQQK